MLPNAQAIVFLLSADTGVTASDMQIWQQHIRQLDEDTQNSLFAVLNKIDVLWDDVAGEAFVQNAIEQIRETTAQQLGIDAADVLPLSAKQALMAKIRGDQALLERSQLAELEQLLSQRIWRRRSACSKIRWCSVMALIQNSQHALRLRPERSSSNATCSPVTSRAAARCCLSSPRARATSTTATISACST